MPSRYLLKSRRMKDFFGAGFFLSAIVTLWFFLPVTVKRLLALR
jgi:hypothetical protein